MPTTMNIGAAKGKNATGPITKKRFVKLDAAATDGESAKQCDTLGELAIGVSLFSVSASEIVKGKGVSIITEGRAIVTASGAIPVMSPVSTAADGRAKVAAAGEYILGVCDEPAAGAGNDCTIDLDTAAKA